MSESAEAIARVLRDLKEGNIGSPTQDQGLFDLNHDTADLVTWGEVIDVTPVYKNWLVEGSKGRMVYEDHRICPPWDNAFLSYVTEAGVVTTISLRCVDVSQAAVYHDGLDGLSKQWADHQKVSGARWDTLADTHVIEWDRVRWIMHAALYMNGADQKTGNRRTIGPLHLWRIAVYPDGEIADVNWIQLVDHIEVSMWDNATMVMLDTFNLVNCVNVEICEPDRPRPAQKRLARTGFTINEIHIRPTSRSYRGKGTPLSGIASGPLHSVRGHTAIYGMEGRGKLFGKYTGRYWIPPHVKGNEMFGVSEHKYVVEP